MSEASLNPLQEASEEELPDPGPRRRVMVGAVGKCVHNLGVETFAEWMEDQGLGYVTIKLGPAVPIHEVINKIRESRPEVVGDQFEEISIGFFLTVRPGDIFQIEVLLLLANEAVLF